ncbi:hypothetical protein AFLA_000825 [Aspergillus flavus NRRL3357]|nr:hypothetical protein AFLA_000825 [Aspergillus flavus NRRL3357]
MIGGSPLAEKGPRLTLHVLSLTPVLNDQSECASPPNTPTFTRGLATIKPPSLEGDSQVAPPRPRSLLSSSAHLLPRPFIARLKEAVEACASGSSKIKLSDPPSPPVVFGS